jgi:hypothetical protein
MDLLRFCNPDAEMRGINRPFSRGEWTYATDGRIIIRVPRVDGYDEDRGPKNAERMFDEAKSREITVWQPLPEYTLEIKACDWCGGKGYVTHCNAWRNPDIKCGKGEWKKCQRYNDDCAIGCTINDKGAEICGDCNGSGRVKISSGPVMNGAVGEVKINAIYLDMIQDLPNIQIAPHDKNSFFRIKFDGGEGLLMPMLMS